MRHSPISATLVAWGNAWLGGHVGLDEAADRVERAGGPQLVAAVDLPPDVLRRVYAENAARLVPALAPAIS